MPRSDHSDRGKRERIERLRARLDTFVRETGNHPLVAVIKGILDLLEDEL